MVKNFGLFEILNITAGPVTESSVKLASNIARSCKDIYYYIGSTVDAGYKNTLGSRKDVLITGMFYIGNARTVFQEMVLDGSYNRHVLITGMFL